MSLLVVLGSLDLIRLVTQALDAILLISRRFHHLEWRLQATMATRSLLSQVGETNVIVEKLSSHR